MIKILSILTATAYATQDISTFTQDGNTLHLFQNSKPVSNLRAITPRLKKKDEWQNATNAFPTLTVHGNLLVEKDLLVGAGTDGTPYIHLDSSKAEISFGDYGTNGYEHTINNGDYNQHEAVIEGGGESSSVTVGETGITLKTSSYNGITLDSAHSDITLKSNSYIILDAGTLELKSLDDITLESGTQRNIIMKNTLYTKNIKMNSGTAGKIEGLDVIQSTTNTGQTFPAWVQSLAPAAMPAASFTAAEVTALKGKAFIEPLFNATEVAALKAKAFTELFTAAEVAELKALLAVTTLSP